SQSNSTPRKLPFCLAAIAPQSNRNFLFARSFVSFRFLLPTETHPACHPEDRLVWGPKDFSTQVACSNNAARIVSREGLETNRSAELKASKSPNPDNRRDRPP